MSLDTIYIIHHTHTDVGYTHDQPVFWELQHRFIEDALRLIEQYADNPLESRFRWTVETTSGLDAWLKTASSRDIDRLVAADKAGLLEVMAMQTNNTPLLNIAQLIESFQPVHRLRRDYGLDIRHAMNCDINGQNWTLGDILLDAGIEAFSMAINHHFGGPPEPRPNVFLWQTPAGRAIPVNNGWTYSRANEFGLADETEENFLEWLPQIEEYLTQIGYPLPFIMLQGYHPFGDNGSAWDGFVKFAKRWNESGRLPKVITATPRMFWERVKAHTSALPTFRGDWTDYWNFGCASTARETGISRTTRSRLFRADAVYAGLSSLIPSPSPEGRRESNSPLPTGEGLGVRGWSERTHSLYRAPAWHALNLHGEHTWGADPAALHPEYEDSLAGENHKKNLAYTARSLSLILEQDALADFARHIPRNDPSELLVFNPLPWERTISGFIPKSILIPRGLPDDSTSGRLLGRQTPPTDFWSGRAGQPYFGGAGWMLAPTTVPAYGYAVASWEALTSMAESAESDDAVVENARYRITFDTQKGGITSLFDKKLNHEWVDASAGYPLHGFVHEEVADHDSPEPRKQLFSVDWTASVETTRGWHPEWQANRSVPDKVLFHKIYRHAFGIVVEQILEHALIGKIYQRVFLPENGDQVEFQSEWQMGTCIHPESTYLAFPFNIPQAQPRFDIGGMPVRLHLDQLPGTCRDYFTVQGWVDFSNGERGVTVATPENPMVQLGGFHFAHNQQELAPERAMLLGWVTNNYWETNFPGAQPGVVTARYAILPYFGDFEESRAHKFALESGHDRPLVTHLGESPAPQQLPVSGTLLHLPQPPVLVLNLRSEAESIRITLFNASDEAQTAAISSGLVSFEEAYLCDLFGNRKEKLAVNNETVEISIAPRQTRILEIR